MDYEMTDSLSHHGILGQKWGQKNGPPYPIGSGDHSASEKRLAKGTVKTLTDYISKKNTDKKKKAAVEKARQTKIQNEEKKKAEEEHNAAREKALKSGSAADVLKFQGELSYNELQNAINRINAEKQLSAIALSDVKTAADKVDEIMNKIERGRNWVVKGTNAYNTVAKIINAFSDEDNLPIIGEKHKTKEDKLKDKLDIKNKGLINENQRLKNDLQRLQNQGEKLKNSQTEMNIDAQKEKTAKKEAEEKKQAKAQRRSEREAKRNRKNETESRNDTKDYTSSVLDEIEDYTLQLLDMNQERIDNATNKKKRKKK